MAESTVQVTEGSGKKLHTFQRTIGGSNVEDEIVIPGLGYLATYRVYSGEVSAATSNSHVLQLMAGASLNVYIRRIKVWQVGLASAATSARHQLFRLTTAGTGGTAVTPAPLDTADAASGATAMTLPSSKGGEGTQLSQVTANFLSAAVATTGNSPFLLYEWNFGDAPFKMLKIPAGAANGIALKATNGVTSTTVVVEVDMLEASF